MVFDAETFELPDGKEETKVILNGYFFKAKTFSLNKAF